MSMSYEDLAALQSQVREERFVTMRQRDVKVPIEGAVVNPGRFPLFEEIIKGFKYKPGYSLTLINPQEAKIEGMAMWRDDSSRFGYMMFKCYIPDSTKFPHEDILVQSQFAVDPFIEDRPREFQIMWLRECIRSFEEHELDEWFRINGELVNDPHASKE